ncbi:hypothetical protein PSACC_03691 [Paramicrosporidium saccamoebae]|uniref:Inositol-pentakisphosphate 2-kinase n=1 Tax=Paramicrosporidium saccamoebae TaxID=1246581 RepID=A0A2H9TFF5_9FUNG|nr:hypothetical protein PSACC_03691 [Paramicrosporidium saccamoebae]
MDVSSLSGPNEWAFLGEGGAHIVFKYTGLALRLSKSNKKKGSLELVTAIARFGLQKYTECPKAAFFTPEFARVLLDSVLAHRALHRLRVPVELDTVAWLYPNYHDSSKDDGLFYSVEIKRRLIATLQGIMNSADFVITTTAFKGLFPKCPDTVPPLSSRAI